MTHDDDDDDNDDDVANNNDDDNLDYYGKVSSFAVIINKNFRRISYTPLPRKCN
jgi:hypothetical protein